MKNLRKNTTAKILALLLLTLFLLTSFGLFFGAGVLQSFGAYDARSLSDCRILDNLMDFKKETLADPNLYADVNAALDFRMKYAAEKDGEPLCNAVVRVEDPSGQTVLYNYEAPTVPGLERRWTLSFARKPYADENMYCFTEGHNNVVDLIPCFSDEELQNVGAGFREWLFEVKGINSLGVSDEELIDQYFGEILDEYYDWVWKCQYQGYSVVPDGWYNVTVGLSEDSVRPLSKAYFAVTGFELRHVILVLAIVSAVLALPLAVFLALSAGWREGNDRPSPTVAERIPLGAFLAVIAAVCWGIGRLIRLISDHPGGVLMLVLQALALYAMTLAVLCALHSLTARFKCKEWWKNTLVYNTGLFVDWTARSLSDVGKVLACGGVWLLVNVIMLAYTADDPTGGLLLIGLFNLIVVVAAAAVAAQWQRLRKSAEIIAGGDTSHRVETKKMLPPLKKHGEAINRMGEGVETAVNEQMKSERMKTDLITNVSHDLKTPLTSIVNYVELLKKEDVGSETAREYIHTLDRQATRLKRLVEDLVEASRATSGSITAQITPINVGELLEQAVSEYEMRLEQSGITPVVAISEHPLTAMADGRLLWRVFDNLMSNVCKYGLAGTRLYINADKEEGGKVVVTFRNISADRLNIPAEELMERFVRGDSSRTTSGSGLGLTIARSLTEVQNGTFSLEIDGDMFKAYVTLPACSST